ncbi:A/G-specific adenine glycosylase [Ammoniphilus sp. YIM 78166]|uniref:A/G-specific adenine glycosylase n=1 Tax=Ammoniphilus sp. YIM 78166 TaxID=1644106 RepID=UPI00106F3D81|nr:A/G-specific adenine glycosylase [Ammoniphilus sp. YIM 78166]
MIQEFRTEDFQQDLLHWFERNLRDLPWRQDRDPYKIWVSEIMLQQTRVDTVIPYFNRFIERFPTLQDLAQAQEDDVLKLWEGLGYYSRARNLHAGVKEVRESYGGAVPDSPEEISKIKGVGPYTAGAILSIAYGKPEPAVDGNVMRVLSRLLVIEDDIQKVKTRKRFETIIRELIAKDNPSYFNQALMELGALICTPKSPKCGHCPVQTHCQAQEAGVQGNLPVKGKAKPPKPVQVSVAFVSDGEKFLIRKRPEQGLLAGLWELPNVEGEQVELENHLVDNHHLEVAGGGQLFHHQHTFSHLQWEMDVYAYRAVKAPLEIEAHWITWEQIQNYTFPVSYQKIFAQIKEFYR